MVLKFPNFKILLEIKEPKSPVVQNRMAITARLPITNSLSVLIECLNCRYKKEK